MHYSITMDIKDRCIFILLKVISSSHMNHCPVFLNQEKGTGFCDEGLTIDPIVCILFLVNKYVTYSFKMLVVTGF